jgi:hypothetical protein
MRTTINIEVNLLNLLEHESSNKGCLVKDLILFLLRREAKEFQVGGHKHSLLSYQPKGLSYQKVHVSFSSLDLDYFWSIKLCSRLSLSFFLKIIIIKRINRQKKLEFEVDNYPPAMHTNIYCIVENMKVFVQVWGIPRKNLEIPIPEKKRA